MNKRYDIKAVSYILREMNRAKEEHPKATIYFDFEDNEVRITYPLPQNFKDFGPIDIAKGLGL